MIRRSFSRSFIKKYRFSRFHLLIFALVFGGLGAYWLFGTHAATPPGASLATCAGGTCTEGSLPTPTARPSSCPTTPTPTSSGVPAGRWVDLGDVSDGVQNECRYYAVYIPNGLSGKAAVLVYGHGNMGCLDSTSDISNGALDQLANANRLVLVFILLGWSSSGTSCTTVRPSSNWFHPDADYPDPGSDVPNDFLYIQTVIHDLEARMTGSITVDTQRIWYMGQSSGGGLATGIACDDATSSLFAGIAWNGVGYNIASTGGTSPLPINGTERCGGGSAPVPTNKNFLVSLTHGGPGGHGYDGFCATVFTAGNPSPDGHCVPGWVEENNFFQTYFGCSAAPTTVFFGTPSAVNESETHSGCARGSGPQIQEIAVPNSGDGYNTVDDTLNGAVNTNGIHLQDIFDFFVNYGGPVAGASSDTTPPTTPSNLTRTASTGTSITISWAASTDNVGVSGYDLYKNGAAAGTTPATTITFSGLTCGANYSLAVDAFDAAGNKSGQASGSFATAACADTSPPSVSMTSPPAGTTVSGSAVAVSASASDNVGVVGVQFKLDGVNLGAEDTASPYLLSWDTTAVSNGIHVLTALARDAAGNTTTATSVSVTVNNPAVTGDLNGDGHVNYLDLSILATYFGTNSMTGDLNHDGRVDFLDLSILASQYGR